MYFRYSIVLIFVSCPISVLCSGTFESDDDHHECVRPCFGEMFSKKTCVYQFFVAESHSAVSNSCNKIEDKNEISTCTNIIIPKNFLAINGRSPGPAIQVCLGDTIEILVYNKLKSDELTFHWHGIRQKDFNYMDGVPMITQCPILPYSSFHYKINPESTGTYFYHAHSVSQQGDGVYGSLTVRGPHDNASLERILVLSSRSSTPLTQQTLLHPPTPDELLVNGQIREVFVRVKHGFSYLLRLINANVYNCPILLSAHGHSLQVLAADGNPVQSMTGTHVVLFPGERLDCILNAEQTIGKYAFDIQGLQDCRNLHHEAYIFYENTRMDSHTIKATGDSLDEQAFKTIENGHHCHSIWKNIICSLDLKNTKLSQLEEKADETFYVPFDTKIFSLITDEMTDNYNIYKLKYYPAHLSKEIFTSCIFVFLYLVKFFSFNDVTFLVKLLLLLKREIIKY